MMITLRKLPLAVAVAAGVMSAQAMAGREAAANNSVSR